MNDLKENNDGSFAYMCGKCLQVFPMVEDIETHNCVSKDNSHQIPDASESYITAEVVKLEPPYTVDESGTTLIVNEKGKLELEAIDVIDDLTREFDIRNIHDENEYELIEAESMKRKRKGGNNDYIMNKLVRDPYFKLDHNSYTFKDTLGDWDERSTKLLIILVGKNPKVHFLLQFYFERRLIHWETIHSCMINAGYNFTVLQLRMRWREVFAKYRWTLNHNDLYEEKKSFEYMKEMDDLFGVWPVEATEALINLVEYNYKDNPSAKHKRLGYMGWERIASLLAREGFKYSVLQVEARWRMLVTTYKSMVDHNIMPTVEPITAAFHDRLRNLINYEPRRRKDYERYKGKKVKLEKFPESGMKHLINVYKQNIDKFMDSSIKNSEVWEEVRRSLDILGYSYSVTKIKEIFFATLKLFERILQHNAIPGAIKREGPHFKELSEIFNMYGVWPHVRRKRKTTFEKHHRKCAQRLRESMQTWTTDQSRALLKLYPSILESLMGQTASTQQNDLWVQVAQAFQALGYQKRDTPEIATHIGLLRQGYNQDNNFPFKEEMQRVMEVEEAICYSPDVSKYTGDVEILYWSHDSIYLMLHLYLKIQPLLPYSSLSKEVYARISKEMARYGYKYTCEEVKEEFRTLLFQFTMRRYKPEKASVENWAKDKGIRHYKDEMKQVMLLREKLSVGFTNGIKPIPDEVVNVIFRVAREKCEEFFSSDLKWEDQKERMKLVIFIIRRQIKKIVNRKPPVARKICVKLLSSLFNITETTERVSEDLAGLYCALQNFDYEKILTEIMKETHNGSFKLPRRVLDMEKQSDSVCSWEEVSDAMEPLCILNVSEVKYFGGSQMTDPEEDEFSFSLDGSTKRQKRNVYHDDEELSSPVTPFRKGENMLLHKVSVADAFKTQNYNNHNLYSDEEEEEEEEEEELGLMPMNSGGRFFFQKEVDEDSKEPFTLFRGHRSTPSAMVLDASADDFLLRDTSDSKAFDKLVLINKRLGTKATVLPHHEGSQVTRINIDDLTGKKEEEQEEIVKVEIKKEPFSSIVLEEEEDNLGEADGANDIVFNGSSDEGTFDVVYSFNEGKFESSSTEEDSQGEALLPASDEGESNSSSIISLLQRHIQKANREQEQDLKVLKNTETERKGMIDQLLFHVDGLVEQ